MSPQASGLPPGPGRSASNPNARPAGGRAASKAPKSSKVRRSLRQRVRRLALYSTVIGCAVCFVSFLNKYGPALIERLSQDPPLDQPGHWILTP